MLITEKEILYDDVLVKSVYLGESGFHGGWFLFTILKFKIVQNSVSCSSRKEFRSHPFILTSKK